MKHQYHKNIEWSQEDNCYIGRCPELFLGGCHGDTKETVSEQLDEIIEDVLSDYQKQGKKPPLPMKRRARLTSAVAAREATRLNQQRFAELIGVKVGTLRNWEQGRTAIPPVAERFLGLLERHPEHTKELLELHSND